MQSWEGRGQQGERAAHRAVSASRDAGESTHGTYLKVRQVRVDTVGTCLP